MKKRTKSVSPPSMRVILSDPELDPLSLGRCTDEVLPWWGSDMETVYPSQGPDRKQVMKQFVKALGFYFNRKMLRIKKGKVGDIEGVLFLEFSSGMYYTVSEHILGMLMEVMDVDRRVTVVLQTKRAAIRVFSHIIAEFQKEDIQNFAVTYYNGDTVYQVTK